MPPAPEQESKAGNGASEGSEQDPNKLAVGTAANYGIQEDDLDGRPQRSLIGGLEEQGGRIILSDEAKNNRIILLNEMLDGVGSDLSVEDRAKLGASFELTHVFSKLLDDIQDEDRVRNGELHPAEYLQDAYGLDEKTAEDITSNYLVQLKTRANRPIRDMDIESDKVLELLDALWDAQEELGVGQNNDILNTVNTTDPDFDEADIARPGERYDRLGHLEEINEKKTGALIRVLGRAVEIVEDLDTDALSRYGEALGKAYQVRDNVIDMAASEDEQGRAPFSDLDEGTYTELTHVAEMYLGSMARTERNQGNEEKAREYEQKLEKIWNVLEGEPGSYDRADLEEAAEIIVGETPAVDTANNIANYEVEKAGEALEDVEWVDDAYQDALEKKALYIGLERGR